MIDWRGAALVASLSSSGVLPASGASSVGELRSVSVRGAFDLHIDAAAAQHGVSTAPAP